MPKMIVLLLLLFQLFILTTNAINVPQIVVKCGKPLLYVDLQTGSWLEKQIPIFQCDGHNALKFCREVYSPLKIGSAVETYQHSQFTSRCSTGVSFCENANTTRTYRCLEDIYDLKLLYVPNQCKVERVLDVATCNQTDVLKKAAINICKSQSMRVTNFGMLKSCGGDLFAGSEFVCCPEIVKILPPEKCSLTAIVKRIKTLVPVTDEVCNIGEIEQKYEEEKEKLRQAMSVAADKWDNTAKTLSGFIIKSYKSYESLSKEVFSLYQQNIKLINAEQDFVTRRYTIEKELCVRQNYDVTKAKMLQNLLAASEKQSVAILEVVFATREFLQTCANQKHDILESLNRVGIQNTHNITQLNRLDAVANATYGMLNCLPAVREVMQLSSGAVLKFQNQRTVEQEVTTGEGITPKLIATKSIVDDYNLTVLEAGGDCRKKKLNGTYDLDSLSAVATEECRKHGMRLQSYGNLFACDPKQYTVVIICCPYVMKSSSKMPMEDFESAVKTYLARVDLGANRTIDCDDLDVAREEKNRLHDDHMVKISGLLELWYEAKQNFHKNSTSSIDALLQLKETWRNVKKHYLEHEKNYAIRWSRFLRIDSCLYKLLYQIFRKKMFKYLRLLRGKSVNKTMSALRDLLDDVREGHVESLYFYKYICEYESMIKPEIFEKLDIYYNQVINESLRLLNYVPAIVKEYGYIEGGVLKPNVYFPPIHSHVQVDGLFAEAERLYGLPYTQPKMDQILEDGKSENISLHFNGITFVHDVCTFHHYINNTMCLQKESLKETLQAKCGRNKIVDSYGMLASCAPDQYLGAAYICCPGIDDIVNTTFGSYRSASFRLMVEHYLGLLTSTGDCYIADYKQKLLDIETHHNNDIQRLDDEWKLVEKRYHILLAGDEDANQKLKNSFEVLKASISAAEEQFKDSKVTLLLEHPECYKEDLAYIKLNAMQGYVKTLKETPMDVEAVYVDLQNVINVCQDDKVRSLYYFALLQKRANEAKGEFLQGELLRHLNYLNEVVNKSFKLLDFFPRTGKRLNIQFGLDVVLKLESDTYKETHSDEKINKMLQRIKMVYPFL